MLKFLPVYLLLSLSLQYVDAQISIGKQQPDYLTHRQNKAQASYKTDALQQRLIGYRRNTYSNGNPLSVDSNTYTYSGTRGSVNAANVLYDVRQRWVLSAGNIVPDSRRSRTWNANGSNTLYLYEDYVSGNFENDTRTLYTYDANGNRISAVNQNWDGVSWDTASKTDFTYNANNQKLSETVSIWASGAWEALYRFSYAYDANGYIAEELYQEDAGNGLENASRVVYTNDAAGNALIELDQDWLGGTWVNDLQFTRIFNAQNQGVEVILQKWTAGAWANEDKLEYTYHSSGYFLSHLEFSWNGTSWDSTSKEYFKYSGNDLIEDSTWIFNGGVPEKYARTTYTYDVNGNADVITFLEWNNNSWQNAQRNSYDYNTSYNNIDRLFKEQWTGNLWQTTEENYYYYEEYNAPSAVITLADVTGIMVYPNPALSVLNIDYSSNTSAEVSVRLVNLNGQEVMRTTTLSSIGDNYLNLPITSLASGLYVIELSQNGQYSYRKFSKQ